jgi:excisionase family DNA binding protein
MNTCPSEAAGASPCLHFPSLPIPSGSRNHLTPLLLDTEQVAELLGLHKKTVEKMCRNESIPGAFKIGKFWRINRAIFEQWLASQGMCSNGIPVKIFSPESLPLGGFA